MSARLKNCFADLQNQNKKAFIAYIMAGDPDLQTSQHILDRLPEAGVDIIELGMPFTDPMADGPAIQAAGLRSLAAGQNIHKTLSMVKDFRAHNQTTPIILMGYYNPIHQYGSLKFLEDAAHAGVDGLIIVDLPPEEDDELCTPAKMQNIDFIRLLTPTSDDKRLPVLLNNTSGFLYYVSVRGITGAASPDIAEVESAVARIRAHSDLPIAIGFGIKTPAQAAAMAKIADAVVVGSALISEIEAQKDSPEACVEAAIALASALAKGVNS